jgi:Kef-type K+ transport system membrane component KefB
VSLTDAETARLLIAVGLLLGAAHLFGSLFARWRLPRVIGEIVGGLVMGPTVFGAVAGDLQGTLFPDDGAVPNALGALYQLGLVLLMFAAGFDLHRFFVRGERHVAVAIALTGVALPFAVGIGCGTLFDLGGLEGTAHDSDALLIVFAAAIAVTSIPVISRIMLDLDLLRTSFARIVLTAAVMEDLFLYALLAVAVGLAQGGSGGIGLAHELSVDPGSAAGALYYVVATTVVLAGALALSHPRVSRTPRLGAVLRRIRSELPLQLLFLLAVTSGCLLVNVTPVFGGLVAGIVIGSIENGRDEPVERLSGFAFAFFVPLYFAIVGFRLDLRSHFDPLFFVGFLAFACLAKASSVYLGARVAGEPPPAARNFAVAMNARGGPGIVLASVALDAGIVNDAFYASLVMLAIVTSLLAGSWLERAVRRGDSLRPEATVAA